jgi:arylsulfatase A-like enzyme
MPPNALLLTIDSLRADAVGMGSEATSRAPTLDELFSNGIVCKRAYANGPYTRASFPAIMSATYPWAYGGFDSLSRDRPHLPVELSEAGYATGGFHSNPYLGSEFGYGRGFDRFYQGDESASGLASLRKAAVRRLDEESPLYWILRGGYKVFESTFGRDLGTPYVAADELTDRALEWLDVVDVPAFCWIHYMDVHHPYVPHQETVSEDVDRATAIRLRQRMVESPSDLEADDVDTLRRLYRGEVEFVDRHVSRLLSGVEKRLEGDAVIVSMADHGEAFGEHGRYGHTDILYDEVVRIPLSVTGADIPDTSLDTPVSCVDVRPTVLDCAGQSPRDPCVGEAVQQLLDDPPTERYVFTHAEDRSDGSVMVSDGSWKLLADADGEPRELYDLTTDEGETENALDAELAVTDRLQTTLEAHLQAVDETERHETATAEIDEETRERLDRLGYVE